MKQDHISGIKIPTLCVDAVINKVYKVQPGFKAALSARPYSIIYHLNGLIMAGLLFQPGTDHYCVPRQKTMFFEVKEKLHETYTNCARAHIQYEDFFSGRLFQKQPVN